MFKYNIKSFSIKAIRNCFNVHPKLKVKIECNVVLFTTLYITIIKTEINIFSVHITYIAIL